MQRVAPEKKGPRVVLLLSQVLFSGRAFPLELRSVGETEW
jgi:hypothetical protein